MKSFYVQFFRFLRLLAVAWGRKWGKRTLGKSWKVFLFVLSGKIRKESKVFRRVLANSAELQVKLWAIAIKACCTYRQCIPYLWTTSEVPALWIVALVCSDSMNNPPFFNVQRQILIVFNTFESNYIGRCTNVHQITCHQAVWRKINKF